jgi:pyruvate dehydrogenase E1 component alpha subunit
LNTPGGRPAASMHLTSGEHGMRGSYASIGAPRCCANGAAGSAQRRDSGQVAVAFFGDGATNIGAFHEAVNYAAVYQLPTVFVCENNLYMEYTSIGQVTPVEHPAADRASAYGLDATIVDGNDADAVYLAAVAAIDRARGGGGPSIIEAKTYRHGGHSRADPGTYRPDDEIAAWMAHDPIPMYHQRLLRVGVPESRLAEIETTDAATIDAATEDAKAAPPPPPDALRTNVWADGATLSRNRPIAPPSREGTHKRCAEILGWCSSAWTSPARVESSRRRADCSLSSVRLG